PEVPELEWDDWRTVSCGPYEWACDASRPVENFTDFGHFPFVHPGLLGGPERPLVPNHEVRTEGSVLHYEIVRPEAPNTDDFPVFANEEAHAPARRSRYALHLPARGAAGARGPQPLRAPPSLHDRPTPRLGRHGGDALLLRLPARSRGPL